MFAAGFAVLIATSTAYAETHHVQVEDFEFIPANLVIAPGDTVNLACECAGSHSNSR
jgi:plastocyanin